MKHKNIDQPGRLPKGAYRLPTGRYVTVGKWSEPDRRGRRTRITAIHKDPPDIDKIARALIRMAEDIAKKEQERDL